MEKIREKLDYIDNEIMRLLFERFELTDEIGRLKAEMGIPVEDRRREEIILQRARNNSVYIEDIYKEILKKSKESQVCNERR